MTPPCPECQNDMIVRKRSVKVAEPSALNMRMLWNADVFVCPVCGCLMLDNFRESELVSPGYIRSMGIEPIMEFVR